MNAADETLNRFIWAVCAVFGLLAVAGVAWLGVKFGFGWEGLAIAVAWLATSVASIYVAWRGYLAAAVVLAVLLRIIFGQLLNWAHILGGDPPTFLLMAQSFQGGVLPALNLGGMGVTWRAMWPPLYPALLAPFLWLPFQPVMIAAGLNLAFQLAAAAVFARAARWMDLPRPELIGVALLLWPYFIIGWPIVGKESLALLLIVSAITMLARWQKTGEVSGLAYGANAAALGLTQPALLPIVIVWSLIVSRPRKLFLAKAAISGAVCLLPWWIITVRETGGLILLTSASGLSFYWTVVGPWIYPAGMPDAEHLRSGYLIREGLNAIASDLITYLTGRVKGFLQALSLEHSYTFVLDRPARTMMIAAEHTLLVSQLSLIIAWFGAAGAAFRLRCPVLINRMLAGGVAVSLLLLNWMEFGARQRLFLAPLLLLAAWTWVSRPDGAQTLPDAK